MANSLKNDNVNQIRESIEEQLKKMATAREVLFKLSLITPQSPLIYVCFDSAYLNLRQSLLWLEEYQKNEI